MAFRVEISPRAFADLDDLASYIEGSSSFEQAERWFNSIMDAIARLGEMPWRCRVAEEAGQLHGDVRVLLHGRRRTYKVFFVIHKTSATVRVLHVRHWARKPLTGPDLQEH